MQSRRRPISNPTAILSADIHIRPDRPAGRIDDYTEAMMNKILFIVDLVLKYKCPWLIAGDLGNKPGDKENKINDNAWPSWLLEWVISEFRKVADEVWPPIVIPGQHDLPNHSLDLWKRSGIGVLQAAQAINLIGLSKDETPYHLKNMAISGFGYSINLQHATSSHEWHRVAMTHQMIIENKELWPDQNAPTGHKLLDEFPEYSLILSGDNHLPFVCEKDGRFLVNPGSMMRNTIGQVNHKPRVYLWYSDENKVEPVYLPIEDNVFDLDYINQQSHNKEKDKRFESLITVVKNVVEIGIKFENNLQQYFDKNKTEKSVVDKIWANVK